MGYNCIGNTSKSTLYYSPCFLLLFTLLTILYFLVERCKGVNESSHVDSIVRIHVMTDTSCGMESGAMNAKMDNGFHEYFVKSSLVANFCASWLVLCLAGVAP